MSNKNYLTKLAEELADKECQKTTLIDKWGAVMYASGHVGAALLGIIGGLFDFAVFYGIIYSAFKIVWLSFALAAVGAGLIQLLFGRSAFQLARSLYEGDHALKEYRSTIFSGLVIVLFSLFATLWLSVNTTPIVHAVNEGNLELVNTEAIRAQYNAEIAQLRDAQKAEEAKALSQVAQLEKDVTAKGEIRWNSHKTINKIHAEQLPTIASRYDRSIASAEKSRDEAIAEGMKTNSTATETFSQKVTFGAITIKGINIVINLLRLVLLVAFAMFLSDVYQERKGKRQNAPSSSFAPAFSQASRPAIMTAEYKAPMSGPLGGLPTASAGEGAAIASPPLGKSHPANPAIAEQVVVKPFHNNRVVDLEVPRMVQWNVAEDDEAATATPATAATAAKKSVGKTAGNATATRGNSNNSNDDNIIVYVNKKGVRKEYLPSDITKQLPTLAARIKAAEKKRNAARAAGDLKALASAEAVIENNTKALERFRALLEKHGA